MRVSIRVTILAAFLLLTITAVTTLSVLNVTGSNEAMRVTAEDLIKRTADTTVERIAKDLGSAQKIA